MGETQAIENHGFYYHRMRKIPGTLLGKNPIYYIFEFQGIENSSDDPKVTQIVRLDVQIHAISLQKGRISYLFKNVSDI